MSIAAPPKSSCSTSHFRYEKDFFYIIRCGVLEQRACIYLGAPNDCFLWISVRRGKNWGRNNSQHCCVNNVGSCCVCWQWCAKGCNNSQQVWDLHCIVGGIQPISLCKPCVMSVRGPSNVGRAVQTDPTLLRYASAITEQKKCWELLAEKFDRFQTLRNNIQQHATGCANGHNV